MRGCCFALGMVLAGSVAAALTVLVGGALVLRGTDRGVGRRHRAAPRGEGSVQRAPARLFRRNHATA